MKYAVMSDAHANPRALRTVLEDAKSLGCDRFVFLGDITGYGYDVKTTLSLVRENFDIILMGNHDSACVGLEMGIEALLNPNYDIDRKQRDLLMAEEVEWLRKREYFHSEDGVAFAHGDFVCPRAWNYIIEKTDALQNFLARDERLMFCGHSHRASVWDVLPNGKIRERFGKRLSRPAFREQCLLLELRPDRRYVVNVGSVGYPRNDLCLTYAIYDSGNLGRECVILRRLPFDFNDYVSEMLDRKLPIPIWLSRWLYPART